LLCRCAAHPALPSFPTRRSSDLSFGRLQQAFHENFALQCGYCTPGMLMTVQGLIESGAEITEDSVRNALSGNICRCTGYTEIVRDRKSTRLNSSHVKISYAVFCL